LQTGKFSGSTHPPTCMSCTWCIRETPPEVRISSAFYCNRILNGRI
jgi:hypothetical protein